MTRIIPADWTDLEGSLQLQLDDAKQTIEGLDRQLKAADALCETFLEEIKDLHREYQPDDCKGCGGTGTVMDTVLCDYPSRLDPMVPAEKQVEIDCEDCLGTGKEWGV